MRTVIAGLISAVVFVALAFDRPVLSDLPNKGASILLPMPIDLALASGDRYLAANLNFFRAVTTPLDAPDSLASRAKFLKRVATLNAKHEDNFYIASGGLAWLGDVDSAQTVLAAAAAARTWDATPYFFQGFNEAHFRKNFDEAAGLVAKAAEVEQGKNKQFFIEFSAKLRSYSEDLDASIGYIKLLQLSAASPGLKQELGRQGRRLVILKELRAAAVAYQAAQGAVLTELGQLVSAGVIDTLPTDPTGIGYELNDTGLPILTGQKR